MSQPTDAATAPLVQLGFTQLEAEVYVTLLGQPSSTGYAVAKQLGRPTANTYKALASLEAKGAVLVEDDGRRHCRAVPADELLDTLSRRFDDQRRDASEALASLAAADDDDGGIYTLRSVDQVLSRCRSMLAQARAFALVDGFPATLERLTPDLLAAAERGVDVAVMAYAPIDLPGVDVSVVTTREVLDGWPAFDAVHVAVDGQEILLGAVVWDEGRVFSAFTSRQPLLAGMLYDGLVAGLALTGLENATEAGATHARLRDVRQNYRRLSLLNTPGFQALATASRGQTAPTR